MKRSDKLLKFPLKGNYTAMLAPSFIVDFSYPEIIHILKKLGFDKVVELTFGAKLVNEEYHKILKNTQKMQIATVCPGVVELITTKYPQYKKNLLPVDSPMITMSKVCKKTYPKNKIIFISPCNYKKEEARLSEYIDYVIDYKELKKIIEKNKIKINNKEKVHFDKFYNDYTKVYPLTGGLSKTAHLKGILKRKEIKIIDGTNRIMKFLENPDKRIKFLDCNFCIGGCIGGPCLNSQERLRKRKKKVIRYLKNSKREDIPESRKGLIEKAKGINIKR